MKLRAWIEPKGADFKAMANVSSIDFETRKIVVTFNNPYFAQTKFEFGDGDYTLMQSTGLKDKNGVEIYEGDIVTLFCQENRGEWNDFEVQGKVTYFEQCAQFLIKRDSSHPPQFGFDLFEMCDHPDYELLEMEVIGNFYENPELLEVKK